jgi:hypothetical protein
MGYCGPSDAAHPADPDQRDCDPKPQIPRLQRRIVAVAHKDDLDNEPNE